MEIQLCPKCHHGYFQEKKHACFDRRTGRRNVSENNNPNSEATYARKNRNSGYCNICCNRNTLCNHVVNRTYLKVCIDCGKDVYRSHNAPGVNSVCFDCKVLRNIMRGRLKRGVKSCVTCRNPIAKKNSLYCSLVCFHVKRREAREAAT